MKTISRWLAICWMVAAVVFGISRLATSIQIQAHEGKENFSLPTLVRSLEVINPQRFRSASGSFVLTVDPSDIRGRAGANYVMRREGEVAWSADHPFTLVDVAISSAGETVGYSYSHGVEGFSDKKGHGDLRVVVLDATGNVRHSDAYDRVGSRYLHESPTPMVAGMFLDEDDDRFVVRVDDPDVNRNIESWWAYQISTGKKLSENPLTSSKSETDGGGYVVTANPVAGTPLTLVHQLHYQSKYEGEKQVGARFSLVDPAIEVVWTLMLPHDYQIDGDAKAERALQDRMIQTGAIVSTSSPSQFELFQSAEQQRVTFQVSAAEVSGETIWSVKEIRREPMNLPAVGPSATHTLAILDQRHAVARLGDSIPSLKSSPPIDLHPDRQRSSIRDIYQFTSADKGRFAFIRDVPDAPSMFVLVNDLGDVLREIPLRLDGEAGHWRTCWLSGDRFLVTRSPLGVEEKSNAWVLDTSTHSLTQLSAFDCASIEDLVSLPNDGFAALATARYEYTMVSGLHAFDSDGTTRWSLQQNSEASPGNLFSPEAIAVNSAGEIVVVDNIRHTLQFFSQQGDFLRRIKLGEAWGRNPEYPSDLEATENGLVVHDFGSARPYVIVDRLGKQLSSFVPRFQDGRRVDCTDFATSTDHHIWVTDRHSLMRLDSHGVVDRVVGPRQTKELQDIVMLEIDRTGKVYAVDGRTATTYVFDHNLNQLNACELAPDDFSGQLFRPSLTIGDHGSIQICVSDFSSRGRYVHFSAMGERLGRFDLNDRIWQLQPRSGKGILVNYENVELRDAERKLIQTIWRRPDGMWLEHPHSVRFADDGTFAVLAESESIDDASVSLFAADATPQHTIVLPRELSDSPRFDYRSDRITVISDHLMAVLDLRGNVLRRCHLTHDSTKWPIPRIAADGRQVFISPGSGTTILRYQMP